MKDGEPDSSRLPRLLSRMPSFHGIKCAGSSTTNSFRNTGLHSRFSGLPTGWAKQSSFLQDLLKSVQASKRVCSSVVACPLFAQNTYRLYTLVTVHGRGGWGESMVVVFCAVRKMAALDEWGGPIGSCQTHLISMLSCSSLFTKALFSQNTLAVHAGETVHGKGARGEHGGHILCSLGNGSIGSVGLN